MTLATVVNRIGRVALFKKSAKEWAGPCPFCGGRDRFVVKADHKGRGERWVCRQCHPTWDDDISFVRRALGCSYREACQELGREARMGGSVGGSSQIQIEVGYGLLPSPTAPNPRWQERGLAFLTWCQRNLWETSGGAQALRYLESRGFNRRAIFEFGLGWNTGEKEYSSRSAWGLRDEKIDEGKWRRSVWLPRGIVIPNFINEELWALAIRRPNGDVANGAKYINIPSDGQNAPSAPFGMHTLSPKLPSVMTEGWLDAMAVYQAAGDLVGAVGIGGVFSGRAPQWVAKMSQSSSVLLAFDSDEAGDQKAGAWWGNVLGAKAKRWAPTRKDPAEMLAAGDDVRGWIMKGLGDSLLELNWANEDLELSSLAWGERAVGRINDAILLAQEIESPGLRIRAMNGIIPERGSFTYV